MPTSRDWVQFGVERKEATLKAEKESLLMRNMSIK